MNIDISVRYILSLPFDGKKNPRFMKVMKACTGTGSGVVSAGGLGRPDGKSTLTKRLADELAGVTSAEISRHESWHRLRGVHLAKKRAEKQVFLSSILGGVVQR